MRPHPNHRPTAHTPTPQAKPLTARTLPADVRRAGPRAFRIALREGRNRQIRRMAEALGFDVVTLHRERFMEISLEGLGPGEWCVCCCYDAWCAVVCVCAC